MTLPSQLPLFVSVARAGSFSSAARLSGISPAAVSKGIAQLEKSLGVRLFHRTTHALTLTGDGQTLLDRVAPSLAAVEDALESISDQQGRPSGRLRVNLPDSFGRSMILPCLYAFMREYPEIELDLHFDDKVRDLVADGFDIGVGNRINQDSRLIARPLYQMQIVTVAAADYLTQHGKPESLEALQQHNCIAYRSPTSGRRVPWMYQDGSEQRQFSPKGKLIVSSIEAGKEAMLAGLGVMNLGRWHVQGALEQGLVSPLLEPFWPAPGTVWIYYSSRQHLPGRTRVFLHHLLRHFGHNPE